MDLRGFASSVNEDTLWDSTYVGDLGDKFVYIPVGLATTRHLTFLFQVIVFQAEAFTVPTGFIELVSGVPTPLNYLGTYNSSGDGLGLNTTHQSRSVWSVHLFTANYDPPLVGIPPSSWALYFSDYGGTPASNDNLFQQDIRYFSYGQVTVRSYAIGARDLDDPFDELTTWRGIPGVFDVQYGTFPQVGADGKSILRPINGLFPQASGVSVTMLTEPGLVAIPRAQPIKALPHIVDAISGTLAEGDTSTPFAYSIPAALWSTMPTSVDFPNSKGYFRIEGDLDSVSGGFGSSFVLEVQDHSGAWVAFLSHTKLLRGRFREWTVQNTLSASDIRQTGNMRLRNDGIGDITYTNLSLAWPDAGTITLQDSGTGVETAVFGDTTGPATDLLGIRADFFPRIQLVPKSRDLAIRLTSASAGSRSYVWFNNDVTVPAGAGDTVSDTVTITVDDRIWQTYPDPLGTVFGDNTIRRVASYTSASPAGNFVVEVQDSTGAWVSPTASIGDGISGGSDMNFFPDITATGTVANGFPSQTVSFRVRAISSGGPWTITGLTWGFAALPDIGVYLDVYETSDSIVGEATVTTRQIASFAYGDDFVVDTLTEITPNPLPEPCDFYGFTVWAQPLTDAAYMAEGGDGVTLTASYETYADVTEQIPWLAVPIFGQINPADDSLIQTLDPSSILTAGGGIPIQDPPWDQTFDPTQGYENALVFAPITDPGDIGGGIPYLNPSVTLLHNPDRPMPSGADTLTYDVDLNWMLLAFSYDARVVTSSTSRSFGLVIG